MVDNYDWFKNISYLEFLREIGKNFSMTQLLDRQFVQKRIGDGGAGISYAEFSYTLIQGYDFLHLYRQYGVDLQLCGADQYGNCTSGIHLIKRLENKDADVWSTPLVIDPVTGRKFGKSEGNAVWLAASDNGNGNFTSIFDFYQFWMNQPDESVEYLIKIYTLLTPEEIEDIMRRHSEAPEKRIAQRALAFGVTSVVHGKGAAEAVENLTATLFNRETDFAEFSEDELLELTESIKQYGILEPIIVRPLGDKYELIAGERRYKANVLSGNDTIPVIIKDLTDAECSEIAIIENSQRKDLSALEEALSYKRTIDLGYDTQQK